MARLHSFDRILRSRFDFVFAVVASLALLVAPSHASDALGEKDVVPFVVVMQMRSGSTWFTTTHLDQHPDMMTATEICVHPGSKTSCPQRVADFEQRCENWVSRSDRHRSWCGFKAKVGSVQQDFDVIFQSRAPGRGVAFQEYRFVHLYRANVVKQALSLVVASATDTWGCEKGDDCQQKLRLRITAEAVIGKVKYFMDESAATCRMLAAVPRERLFEVAYEDLLADEIATVHSVYDFLGVRRWSGWTQARERQSDVEDPFKSLSYKEQDRLRRLLRERYPGLRLESLLDNDDGSLYTAACSAQHANYV